MHVRLCQGAWLMSSCSLRHAETLGNPHAPPCALPASPDLLLLVLVLGACLHQLATDLTAWPAWARSWATALEVEGPASLKEASREGRPTDLRPWSRASLQRCAPFMAAGSLPQMRACCSAEDRG